MINNNTNTTMQQGNNLATENDSTLEDLFVIGGITFLTTLAVGGIKAGFKKIDSYLTTTEKYQKEILPEQIKAAEKARKAKEAYDEAMKEDREELKRMEEERRKKKEEEKKAKEEKSKAEESSEEKSSIKESVKTEEKPSKEEPEDEEVIEERVESITKEETSEKEISSEDEEIVEDVTEEETLSEEDEDLLNYIDSDIDEMSMEEKLDAVNKAKKFQNLVASVKGIDPIIAKVNHQIIMIAEKQVEEYLDVKDIDFGDYNPKYMAVPKKLFIKKLNDIYKVMGSDVVLKPDKLNLAKLLEGETVVKEFSSENSYTLLYPVAIDKFSFAVVNLNTMAGTVDYALFVYDGSESYKLIDEYSFDICK